MNSTIHGVARRAPLACLLIAAFTFAAPFTAPAHAQAPEASSAGTSENADWEGLVRIEVAGLAEVYRRPGTSLAGYDKLMIEVPRVSFRAGWERDQKRASATRGGRVDVSRIRREIADIALAEFSKELTEKGAYRIVRAPAPDVLMVSAILRDIDFIPSGAGGPGRSYLLRTPNTPYRMTLVAELRDSESGELLARVVDRKSSSPGTIQIVSSVSNSAEARRAIKAWATILRQRLDDAKATPGG